PSGIADPWWRVHMNWRRLAGSYPSEFVRTFFVRSAGSWHLLDLPPLGGGLAALVGVSWLATALALGRRGWAFAAHLVVFVGGLVVLTALQHLVTDFEDYRDVMLVIGATTPAIGVALVAPRTAGFRRAVLLVWALAVAAHGWIDLGNL